MRRVRFLFAGVVLLTVLIAGVVWQFGSSGWSGAVQVSGGTNDSRLVDVLVDPRGAVIHLVWEDNRDGIMQVFYTRTVDNGVNWAQEIRLTHLSTHTVEPEPRLASGDYVLFVFFSNRTETGEHLFYETSNDQGSHFSTPRQLTSDPGDQSNAVASVFGSSVHVVWQGYSSGDEHIYYMRSLDSGSSWGPEVELTNATEMDRHPSLSVVDGKVFVVWTRLNEAGGESVLFKASYDNGGTWQGEQAISSPEVPVFMAFPSVGSDGNLVHVVWNGQTVTYVRSNDAGRTWNFPSPLTNTTKQYLAPRIAVVGSHLKVVAAAISTQSEGRILQVSSDIYLMESDDNGGHWTHPLSITNHSRALALAPALSLLPRATFIAWQDDRNGPFAVFFVSNPDFAMLDSLRAELPVVAASVILVTSLIYATIEVNNRAAKKSRRRRRPQRGRRGRTKK